MRKRFVYAGRAVAEPDLCFLPAKDSERYGMNDVPGALVN